MRITPGARLRERRRDCVAGEAREERFERHFCRRLFVKARLMRLAPAHFNGEREIGCSLVEAPLHGVVKRDVHDNAGPRRASSGRRASLTIVRDNRRCARRTRRPRRGTRDRCRRRSIASVRPKNDRARTITAGRPRLASTRMSGAGSEHSCFGAAKDRSHPPANLRLIRLKIFAHAASMVAPAARNVGRMLLSRRGISASVAT